jgi:hypothetical protein
MNHFFAYRTAIEKNPDVFECLIGMGQMLFQNKLFAESAVCYDHAIPMVCCNLSDVLLYFECYGLRQYNRVI